MIYIIILIIGICVISAIVCHYSIEITKYNIVNEKIEETSNGLKIIQLSDLHNRSIGKNSSRLIKKINKLEPDIIVITGDLLDYSMHGISKMLNLVETLVRKYKCYYVLGNHELCLWEEKFNYAMSEMKKRGVTILNNGSLFVTDKIKLYGIGYNLKTDLNTKFKYCYKEKISKQDIIKEIGVLDNKKFNVLLAHNPFSFDAYSEVGFDLVFSGHVHGGIIRIPGIGGLLSPQRKLFPKYSEGIYKKGDTQMIVSRGLGYGGIKFRIFNRPEIVVVTLKNR